MRWVWEKQKDRALRMASCLLLSLLLGAGVLSVCRASRDVPDTPVPPRALAGLNIAPVGLRPGEGDAQPASSAVGGRQSDGGASADAPFPPENTQSQTPESPDTPRPGDEPSGAGDADGGGEAQENPGAPAGEGSDDEKPAMQLITDLSNRTIAYHTLANDTLPFSAYLVNAEEGAYVRVRLQNSDSAGRWLTGRDGAYTAVLAQGENVFSLLIRKGTEVLASYTKVIVYQAPMADGDNPAVGDDPPVIATNLDGTDCQTSNRNFTLRVTARNSGGYIYHNHIRVTLDGQEITQYTGATALEYPLYFKHGAVGDESVHQVTVLAWDERGNSACKSYTVVYHFTDAGEVIGQATLRLDLSVLGLGVLEGPYTCDIRQDVPASYAVQAFLESCGYTVQYGGVPDAGYYLQRLESYGSFKYAAVPEELQTLLALDGLTLSRPADYKNSLGEFDYTIGSGWMYEVNGAYPGKGLSNFYLSDGDVLRIVFTLAYGKDVGGGDDSGAQRGNLARYCGTWRGGAYLPSHEFAEGVCTICGLRETAHTHSYEETVTKAPTCTEAGEKTAVCAVCGESAVQPVAALGHGYAAEEVQWSEDGRSCEMRCVCTRCGAQYTASASVDEGAIMVIDHRPPTCTEAGYTTYRITAVIDGRSISHDALLTQAASGHRYVDGVCSVCGGAQPEAAEEET